MTDAKIVAKIEALLRKAESTNFGPESEALIAKAHELMARYSIEEAMLHKAQGVSNEVIVMTIPAKSKSTLYERQILIGQVAKWQRCRAIITGEVVSVVGYRTDAEFVKTLYSSLVLQMMDSMLEQTDGTEKWNRSFCRGFINAVSSRMEEVYRKVEHDVAPSGSSTALVLRDRSQAVEQQFDSLFPNSQAARGSSMTTVDGKAMTAGIKAGKNADVGVTGVGSRKDQIGPSKRELG